MKFESSASAETIVPKADWINFQTNYYEINISIFKNNNNFRLIQYFNRVKLSKVFVPEKQHLGEYMLEKGLGNEGEAKLGNWNRFTVH